MYRVEAYQLSDDAAIVSPLPMKRDWMDKTFDGHAYRCFPLSLTNQMGWGFSFPEDITVIWDGDDTEQGNHIQVISGNKYVDTNRGTATLIFNINWLFKTDQNVSLLFFGPPNLVKDGAFPLSNIMSTSFWRKPVPFSWKITRPNVPITFKANEPFMAVMPISLTALNESELILNSFQGDINEYYREVQEYASAILENNKIPKWSDFYRSATDQFGNRVGEHEIKKIKMNIVDNRSLL